MSEPEFRNEVVCKGCSKSFYDTYNLVCLSALNYCLKCANQYVKKEDIDKKFEC